MHGNAAAGKQHPGYSIRVVARMTGIPADTLRMWERRYGFPKPERADNGVRAYTPADVERLGLVVRALSAGHRPGQVVGMDREELARMVAETSEAVVPSPPAAVRGTPSTVQSVVDALLSADVLAVYRGIRNASATLGARAFLTDFAHPLVVRVGELWHQGQLEVRHEHLVTEALSTQIRVLSSTYEDLRGTPSVLMAILPEEQHALGSQMTGLMLSLEGARVHSLGTPAPPEQIARAARELAVDVIGLSVVRDAPPGAHDAMLVALLDVLPRSIELWLGGRGIGQVRLERPNLHRFPSWSELPDALERLRRR